MLEPEKQSRWECTIALVLTDGSRQTWQASGVPAEGEALAVVAKMVDGEEHGLGILAEAVWAACTHMSASTYTEAHKHAAEKFMAAANVYLAASKQ